MSRLYDGWNLIPAKPAGEVFADVILIARHGVSPKKLHISIREGSMMAMFKGLLGYYWKYEIYECKF